MKPTVYVETSVIGYLTARPSRDLVTAARQQVTREWWEERSRFFDLYISQFVLDEIARGHPAAAEKRLEVARLLPRLDTTPEAVDFAAILVEQIPLPPQASVDAQHIAVATVHGLDYLVTWNNQHIAGARRKDRIQEVCRSAGYRAPSIVNPDML